MEKLNNRVEKLNRKVKKLLADKKHKEAFLLIEKEAKQFWAKDYILMTLDEKINYWSGTIHMSMRERGHSGLEEMGFFSPENYASIVEYEPDIENILPEILKKLGISKLAAYKKFGIE